MTGVILLLLCKYYSAMNVIDRLFLFAPTTAAYTTISKALRSGTCSTPTLKSARGA
jgi:hypothetical protein